MHITLREGDGNAVIIQSIVYQFFGTVDITNTLRHKHTLLHGDGDRAVAEFPLQLTDGFEEGGRFDVTDGAANLLDDEVDIVVLHDAVFDLVGDMRHYLNGLAEIVAVACLVDDSLVDLTRGHRVGLSC